jgi:hypothetical protein
MCIVVPDEHIDKARDLLLAVGFPPCQMGNNCPLYHRFSSRAIPYAHFNLVDLGRLDYYKPEEFGKDPRQWYTLELFKKSDVLWGAPEIPAGPPPPNDPDWWTVTDERLPELAIQHQLGRMVTADFPVKIPSPARFTESLTLLFFRDNYPEDTARGAYWDVLLLDMQVVMKKHGLFTFKDLPPRTRSWFTILTKTPRERTHGGAQERFAVAMRKAGEVPERSPWPSAVFGLPGWREELREYDEMMKKKKEEEEEQKRKKEEEARGKQNA